MVVMTNMIIISSIRAQMVTFNKGKVSNPYAGSAPVAKLCLSL